MYYHGEPDELYDLRADRGEQVNLATAPGNRSITKDLKSKILTNWDPDAIDARVRTHQKERALIAKVEGHGTFE